MRTKPTAALCVAALSLAGAGATITTVAGASGRTLHAQRFTMQGATVNGVDRPIHVTATGPIAGHGTAKDKDSPGGRSGRLTFHLPAGNIFLPNTTTSSTAHVDLRRCRVKILERGTFTIAGGTKRYRHAIGHGTYVDHRTIVGRRTSSGRCASRRTPPKAVYDAAILTGEAAR
jgi:hypothetical protein